MQLEKGSALRRTFQTNLAFALLTAFLVIFPHLVGAMTGTSPFARRGLAVYWQGIVAELLIIAMLAMSYNLVFGFTGVISFGHAMFFGLGGYVLGGFLRAFGPDTGMLVGILAAIAISTVLGLVIGIVSLRLKGVYFAMFTLALAEMFFIYFRSYGPTGSEDGFSVSAIPEWLDPTRSRINFYYIAVILFVLMFLFIRRLIVSPTGAVLLGIRENENRARAIGYNTLTFKVLALTISGVLATISGMMFVLYNKKVGPEMLSSVFTVDPLLMTIIGGIGTFTGPIVGAVGLRLTEIQLRNVTLTIGSSVIDIGKSWTLILGAIFVLVVIVFPQGVIGTYHRWRAKSQARRQTARTASQPAGD